MRKSTVNTKVKEGGGAPGAREDISLQSVEKTMLEQISTLQPMEDSMPEQVDISSRNCGLWRAHRGADIS